MLINMLHYNMPYCYAPWTNIDISPQGVIAPCCKFQVDQYDQAFNINTTTIKQYTKSDFLNIVKQEFDQGLWPKGCERCRIEEDNGVESKRQLDYARWQEHYKKSSDTYLTASLSFGNTCNLKCITCSSEASSKWRDEYLDIYGTLIPHNKFYKATFVADFVEQAPDIIHFDIVGGEPFLSGVFEQMDLLSHYVQTGQAKNITLHYTTNVTVMPDGLFFELWEHFKEIDIQLSIDGIGPRYEYIRFPAEWGDVLENVKQWLRISEVKPNLRLSVSHTVSAYNIFYLDEFFQWCYNLRLPRPWIGRVHNPAHMRPSVWSGPARDAIINELSRSGYEDVRLWANLISNTDDTEHYSTFIKKLHEHDEYRQTDFATTFPELAKHL